MYLTPIEINTFSDKLLQWASKIDRQMPWKGELNPYYIWLSEIILQQTRVEQGLPYYERFKAKYPVVKDLADAPEDEVMKLWEGLGYYSRARNLHTTAKYIAYDLKGKFPNTYENIIKLKGVGTYTAAAIASFAFNLPRAVVDGNVYRVISRYLGIDKPIDVTEGKKYFAKIADELLRKDIPGKYNQAIMDFGAIHCMPKKPLCSDCLFKDNCIAYQQKKIHVYPVKSKKIKKRQRFFNYLVLNFEDKVLIRKRVEKDIWRNLYEFPMIESSAILSKDELIQSELWQKFVAQYQPKIIRTSKPFQQTLTHQKIVAVFWEVTVNTPILPTSNDFKIIDKKNLEKFAFPKLFSWYFEDKSLTLTLF